MKFLTTLNPEQVTEEEAKSYTVRTAVRAIVFDKDNNVALLSVSNKNYYKLPGGGVEEGESIQEALQRECQEELGCNIEIISELGELVEYRKQFNLKQISPCYIAKVIGDKGVPSFTEEELKDGFQIKWLPLSDAAALIATSSTDDYEGKLYIVPRDSLFLAEALKIV